jgi:diguanylate cyclase (GGDEF)-like protein
LSAPKQGQAEADLAILRGQVEAARVVLARLLQEVIVAESRTAAGEAARVLAADEQLVATALRNRIEGERAAKILERTSRSAERDPLTQLPNRVLLLDRCAQAIAAARRDGGRLAVLFLDLNDFKRINGTLGRPAGDEVLKLVAHRLVSTVGDADTVSRQDEDEFVILLTRIARPSDVGRAACDVVNALGAPGRIGDTVLRLSASLGISLYPEDGDKGEKLVERAGAAMKRAKRHGLGSFAFHGSKAAFQGTLPRPPVAALKNPIARHETATEELLRRRDELREQNEKVMLSVLGAQELKAAAERAHRRQSEFMSITANELRDPRAPIRVAAAMLGIEHPEEPLLPRAQSLVEERAERMARLVAAAREVPRKGAYALGFERKRVDLASVVNDAVDASRPAMDTRLQVFTVELPSFEVHVMGDPARLDQAIRNLLDNASKYTPEFGRIGLALRDEGDEVELTVSDNGIGITSVALPSLFQPFVQDGQSLGFNEVGTGIGLTVVRTLVEAHGGKVIARSAGSGQGSRFIVTLARVA